jgi:hypothetical protein
MTTPVILDLVFYGAGIAAVGAVPFLLVNVFRYRQARARSAYPDRVPGFPAKSIGFFIVPIVVVAVTAHLATSSTRWNVLEFLQRSPAGGLTVTVDRRLTSDPEEIVSVLRRVAPQWGHHSHPTRRIRVELTGTTGRLIVELARDSGNPQEYWVFVPEHAITSNNEIGRVTTSLFDRY